MGSVRPYSGKGSGRSNVTTSQVSNPVAQIISLVEEIDVKTQRVKEAEDYLDRAREELRQTQIKLKEKLDNLDPNTRNLLRSMLSQMDSQNGKRGFHI